MPTIKEILTERKTFITETTALEKMEVPITPEAATWLRSQLAHELLDLDGKVIRIYRRGEVRNLCHTLAGRRKFFQTDTGWKRCAIKPWTPTDTTTDQPNNQNT